MHRFLIRLSSPFILAMISSCTLQITQIHYPSNPQSDSMHDVSQSPLTELDNSINDAEVSLDTTKIDGETLCDQYEFPELENVPTMPYVPPEKRSDDKYVSNLLVEHVNQLSEFIENTERTINASYEKYLETCR